MMLIIALATGCSFDFGVLVLISSSKIWMYVNWTSQILPNLAFESLTTDFELLKHSYFIAKSIMYFDGVAQLVFLSLFPCLYTNKRESLDREAFVVLGMYAMRVDIFPGIMPFRFIAAVNVYRLIP